MRGHGLDPDTCEGAKSSQRSQNFGKMLSVVESDGGVGIQIGKFHRGFLKWSHVPTLISYTQVSEDFEVHFVNFIAYALSARMVHLCGFQGC